jgi:hypothetical protein
MKFVLRLYKGDGSIRLPVVVRPARAKAATASTAAWAWSSATCTSAYAPRPGLSVDPGYSSSYDGADDSMAYRYWIYTWAGSWAASRWERYALSSKYHAPAFGGIWIGGEDYFGRRPGGGAWVYVAIQKYWYRAAHSEYLYPPMDSNLGGLISGNWCFWTG